MKRLILFPLLFLCFAVNAQDIRLVKILSEDHMLDKSCDDCVSNIVMPVSIPANTAFIYIAISTGRNGHFKNINLLGQVRQLTATHTITILGDLKPLIEHITGCDSGGTINFHVETDGNEAGHKKFKKRLGLCVRLFKMQDRFSGRTHRFPGCTK